ncbi:MAG: N-acetyltransferase family protein [bacterium]
MGRPVTIRPATREDYPAVCALLDQLDAMHCEALPRVFRHPQPPARSREYVESILADEEATLLLAESGGEAVGLAHAAIRRSRDIPALVPRRFAVVDDLVVAPGWQGRGVGRALMEAVEAWAGERGASDVELTVWEFNRQAAAFYQALDYRVASRRMWKPLDDA